MPETMEILPETAGLSSEETCVSLVEKNVSMGDKAMKKLEQLWQTFLSVVKILLQSKWSTHLPSSFSNPEELLILANGPSLNRTVQEAADFVKGKTLLAVNFCVTSPMFEQLRPEIYLIADPLFWIVPENVYSCFRRLPKRPLGR